jgi:hypothetical protein
MAPQIAVTSNRLQSSHHTRKINVKPKEMASGENQSNSAFNRRRVVKHPNGNIQHIHLDTGDLEKNLSSQGQTHRVSNNDQNSAGMQKHDSLHSSKPQAQSQNSQNFIMKQAIEQAARATAYHKTEPDKAVIYHPHPLNQNMAQLEFNTI